MNISPTEALKLYNVSKPTLYKDMNDGKLSFVLDDREKRKINVAELDRLYSKRQENPVDDTNQFNVKERKSLTESHKETTNIEIELLRQKVQSLEEAKDHVQEERDYLRDRLKESQEGQNRMALLLEDQRGKESGVGEWDKQFKALEARLANREKEDKERKEREQKIIDENKRLKTIATRQKKALEEEKNKNRGFFQKLFG